MALKHRRCYRARLRIAGAISKLRPCFAAFQLSTRAISHHKRPRSDRFNTSLKENMYVKELWETWCNGFYRQRSLLFSRAEEQHSPHLGEGFFLSHCFDVRGKEIFPNTLRA